jgi:hypothetical protein
MLVTAVVEASRWHKRPQRSQCLLRNSKRCLRTSPMCIWVVHCACYASQRGVYAHRPCVCKSRRCLRTSPMRMDREGGLFAGYEVRRSPFSMDHPSDTHTACAYGQGGGLGYAHRLRVWTGGWSRICTPPARMDRGVVHSRVTRKGAPTR